MRREYDAAIKRARDAIREAEARAAMLEIEERLARDLAVAIIRAGVAETMVHVPGAIKRRAEDLLTKAIQAIMRGTI